MKKVYHVGDDLFVVIAFVSFVVAVISRLLGISPIFWGITPLQLFNGALACLLFSIALSLRDMAQVGR
jgi:hypothetical protein